MEATERAKPFQDPQLARLAQQKSVQARHDNKMAKLIASKLPLQLTPNSPQVAIIERQLLRINVMIEQATTSKELAELTAAHTRLFNTWQVLTGTPNPGSRRVKSERLRGISSVEPLPESSDPTPATPQDQNPV